MNCSAELNEIAGALAKAQGEFVAIEKARTAMVKGQTKDGRSFDYTYKYADIADVLTGILPPLSKHGLSVIQPTFVENSVMVIRTRVMHSSGQWIESDYPVSSITGDHQKMGGALTYARRYALCSLIGVAAEEDTDGQHVAEQPTVPNRKPIQQTQTSPRGQQSRNDDTQHRDEAGDAESAKITATIIGTLNFCESEDSLKEWGKANKPATLRCNADDQQRITQAYMAKRAEIMSPRSEAAE